MSMVKEAMRAEKTGIDRGRTVAGIVNSIETLEGGGFLVRRPFPKASFSDFDPFLLLDEMGPMDVAPGEAKGAPDHHIAGSRRSLICSRVIWNIRIPVGTPDGSDRATCSG
jgi:hypothetical protein